MFEANVFVMSHPMMYHYSEAGNCYEANCGASKPAGKQVLIVWHVLYTGNHAAMSSILLIKHTPAIRNIKSDKGSWLHRQIKVC